MSDDKLHAIKVEALHKAAAMLRRTNGPDPREADGFDDYDLSMVSESYIWSGVMGAADTLDEYADMVRPL